MATFRCGRCAEPVHAKDGDAGRLIPCPRCGHGNLCPAPPAPAPLPVPRVVVLAAPRRSRPGLWLLAGAIVLVSGWGLWRAVGASPVAGSSDSPADARQREILAENLGQPGDPGLDAMFAAVNASHFEGALPPTPVRWEPRLDEVGALAGRAFTLQGMFGHAGKRTVLLLNPILRSDPEALKRALCHEMVHAHFHAIGDTATDHGPAFQDVLRRLAAERAFEGIVASDEEMQGLRAWLDEESARLDAAHEAERRVRQELDRERAEVERAIADLDDRIRAANTAGRGWPTEDEVDAVKRRRDAYNIHVADANRQVEQNQSALAEFNRQVERYNLMATYPDGLDAPARIAPRVIPAANARAR